MRPIVCALLLALVAQEPGDQEACDLSFQQAPYDSLCASGSFVDFTFVGPPRPQPKIGDGCQFDITYWTQIWDGHTGEWEDYGRRWWGHVPCGWRFHHFELCRTCGKFLGEAWITCWAYSPH